MLITHRCQSLRTESGVYIYRFDEVFNTSATGMYNVKGCVIVKASLQPCHFNSAAGRERVSNQARNVIR